MMRRLMLALVMLGVCLPAWGRTKFYGWCQNGSPSVVVPGTGGSGNQKVMQAFPSCTITVYLPGTTTLTTLYADQSGTAKANPFTAASNSQWFAYTDEPDVDVKLSGGGIASPFTIGNWISNPVASILGFGAKCDSLTNDANAFSLAATTLASGGTVTIPDSKTCVVNSNTTIPASVNVVSGGGKISVSVGKTLTLNGGFWGPCASFLFPGAGTVVLNPSSNPIICTAWTNSNLTNNYPVVSTLVVDDLGGAANTGGRISIAGSPTEAFLLGNWYFGGPNANGGGVPRMDRTSRTGGSPQILFENVGNPGSGFAPGDIVFIQGLSNPAGTALLAGGGGGTLWLPTFKMQAGGGATFYAPRAAGFIADVAINTAGAGYTVGDVCTVPGGVGGTITVLAATAGVPSQIQISNSGTSGYTTATGVAVVGGTGAGLKINVVATTGKNTIIMDSNGQDVDFDMRHGNGARWSFGMFGAGDNFHLFDASTGADAITVTYATAAVAFAGALTFPSVTVTGVTSTAWTAGAGQSAGFAFAPNAGGNTALFGAVGANGALTPGTVIGDTVLRLATQAFFLSTDGGGTNAFKCAAGANPLCTFGGTVSLSSGATAIFRCTSAGAARSGTLTSVSADCGTSVDTGLRTP